MSLNKLPTEITEQIIWQGIPDGFESIALTCKSLFQVCQPLISGYNKKKRRFRTFTYSRHSLDAICNAPGDQSTCNVLQHWDHATATTGYKIPDIFALLCAVLKDAMVGRFIHSLDLKHNQVRLPLSSADNSLDHIRGPCAVWNSEDKMRLRQFLSHSVSRWGMSEDFSSYNLDTMSILEAEIWLLTLLPYVTEIALSKAWAYSIPPSWMVHLEAIVKRANDSTKSEAPLSRLSVMKPFVGHGYASIASLSQLTPFLSLNSLQEFYMGGIKAFEFSPEQEYFHPGHFGRSLTKIELNGSCIGGTELFGLLSRTPNLKCLHLSLESKPNYCGYSYDIGRLLAIICFHLGDVIEDLAISTNPMSRNTTTLSSMEGFKALKYLELDFYAFWGPAFSDPVLSSNAQARYAGSTVGQMSRLVDILPSCLESAKIFAKRLTDESRFRPAEVTSLLRGFREQRSSKLQRLVNIDLICPPADGEIGTTQIMEALRILAEAGLGVYHYPQHECASSFTTTFNSRFGVGDASRG